MYVVNIFRHFMAAIAGAPGASRNAHSESHDPSFWILHAR